MCTNIPYDVEIYGAMSDCEHPVELILIIITFVIFDRLSSFLYEFRNIKTCCVSKVFCRNVY